MSTILLTGANGFVGSHVLPEVLRAGHGVVALVRTRRAADRMLERLPHADRLRVRIALGDVTDPISLPAAFSSRTGNVDAVVHLVAIPRDFNGGRELRRVNTDGTRNVVEAAQAAGVRRVIHQSAMGVVDDPQLHYASSKAQGEEIVRRSGLDWTILKPSLLWGEGDGFFSLIAMLARLSPGVIPVPGDGLARFQPFFVGRPRAHRGGVPRPARRRSGARSSSVARATGRTARSRPRSSPRSASSGSSCPCRCR